MRITKGEATVTANKMIEKRRDAIQKMKDDLKKWLTDKYVKTIPKKIVDAYKAHPEFFETVNYLYVRKEGSSNRESEQVNKVISNYGNYRAEIVFSKTEMIEYEKKIAAIKVEEGKLKDFKLEIESALLNLRTFKRIEAELPEAKPFLPTVVYAAPAINYQNLNKRIKSAVSQTPITK